MKSYDYIIIGSGIAGLYTALLAQRIGSVLILTKGDIDECNTKHAQGGIAAPIGPDDSPDLHFQDTIAAGAGLCDTETVRILVEEATDRIHDLVEFGVSFDTVNGEIALTREAAHSVPRILHAWGDATGEHIEVTLSNAARASKRVTILENCLVTEIVIQDAAVRGVVALDCRSGATEEFSCRFLVLASGGAGRLFKFNTNTDVATGDGVALACRAGAEITDMEFFQFHPTALRLPGVPVFLISEAVRGEGGILLNAAGHRFMLDYSQDSELAPRDIVARGILSEMKKTNTDRVFLDVTQLPARRLSARFPHIYSFCLSHGLDITGCQIPVAPAAHYMIGGVRTNVWGETNIRGLFACGETACTGVHGANRLASNSLLEVLVFSKRIVERTKEATTPEISASVRDEAASLEERDTKGRRVPSPDLTALQTLLWDKVGMVRCRDELEEAATTLAAWQRDLKKPTDRSSWELYNMIIVGRLMTEAALIREESRGVHFRSDFPEPSPAWKRHIIFKQRCEG